jgi:putative endopeptidase
MGLDLSAQDSATRPGDDFYLHANGGWLRRTEIPANAVTVGTIEALQDMAREQVRAILEEEASRTPLHPTDAAGKVGAFYRSFMDEKRVEALGAKPLQPALAAVRRARTRAGIAALMGRTASSFHESLFAVGIEPDSKDPSRNALELFQGGLGLPDREYYLKPEFSRQRIEYGKYAAKMLSLAGWPQPERRAQEILAFETAVAQASWSAEEQRDPNRMYNPMSPAELARRAPGFPWRAFLAGIGAGPTNRIVVGEASAFPGLAALFARMPVSTLQAWQAFRTADNAAPYLSRPFVLARFQFRGTTLSGRTQEAPRWRRGLDVVDRGMGWAVGDLFVQRHFPPEAKAQMEQLVGHLREAFGNRIRMLPWMGQETKAEALAKLSHIAVKVGYPDRPRDYSRLRVDGDDLYGNVERGTQEEWRWLAAGLRHPVDRGLWPIKPQNISAYHNTVMNDIGFPAAKLHLPYFSPDADAAVNYGAIGAVIGHEMTHAFDDEGRQYDASGRLRDWWQPADAQAFQALAAKLASQYATVEMFPGLRINGALTLGENIADLGGIMLALDAYHASLSGRPAPVIDGLTGDQRFFLSWAQVWRQKEREDLTRRFLVSDPHAPPSARVNVVLANVDAWYSAFDVRPGDKLYRPPSDRVRIW